MNDPHLFTPLQLRAVTIPNRIVVSPMSQYIAVDGYANDWHFAHLSRFALGGAGLVFTEATAVQAHGRRTHGDLGLWEDAQIAGLARIAAFLDGEGSVPGIQLAHAGRKASERRPWHGETPVDDVDIAERGESPWRALAPSPIPYGDSWPAPVAMSLTDIAQCIDAFANAAARAREAGFRVIDIYAGHGFLLHQFCSPISNERTDAYGGSRENRMRLSLEVVRAIRLVWPEEFPLMYRVSATDWLDGGWTVEDTVALSRALKDCGVDVMDCTTGGIGGARKPQRMPLAQGFQVPYAEQVRRDAAMATMAVGFIWDPEFANEVVAAGRADLVALARELLSDPNWPVHAARELGLDPEFARWRPQFGWWLKRREQVIAKLGLRDRED